MKQAFNLHIHIFQRERNPDILRVDLALRKQDNRLLYSISDSCQITAEISKPVYRASRYTGKQF